MNVDAPLPANDRSPSSVRRSCEALFHQAGIEFNPYTHEPVLDYETATTVRERFNLSGRETKALFLHAKSGRYVMFVSLEGERLDRKRAQAALGEKTSMASGDELQTETGCVPGCAVPLGLPQHVALLIDPKLVGESDLIFSPGPPTETLQVTQKQWESLLKVVKNDKFEY